MVRGTAHREHGANRALVPCGVAVAVTTTLLVLVAPSDLEEVSPGALTVGAFQAGASALFLAAGILRISRWRVTTDPHSGLLAASMIVLGLLASPGADLSGQLLPGPVEPVPALGARTAVTAVCVALALRAMTVHDDGARTDWRRTLLVATAVAVAGVSALAGLFAAAPGHLTGPAVVHVTVNVLLAGTWLTLGLVASLRDAKQPWAGRVAPLYASLGLVELMLGLDQVQPGSWSVPSAALLGSVAAISAHAAYVDLAESSRFVSVVRRRTAEIRAARTDTPGSTQKITEPVAEFDVAGCVRSVVEQHLASGQEMRVRGGAGFAHARPGDLTAALEQLLVNAHTYAPHSSVTVHVLAIGTRVEVTVADHGPRLKSEDLRTETTEKQSTTQDQMS